MLDMNRQPEDKGNTTFLKDYSTGKVFRENGF
ncbi:MAG: hypothetical protein FD181_1798 [Prolixibacteraceae bacterium]|nr:MAG: hypothetical protein FD181_1798 [Prolixibacteraceae bacterium]